MKAGATSGLINCSMTQDPSETATSTPAYPPSAPVTPPMPVFTDAPAPSVIETVSENPPSVIETVSEMPPPVSETMSEIQASVVEPIPVAAEISAETSVEKLSMQSPLLALITCARQRTEQFVNESFQFKNSVTEGFGRSYNENINPSVNFARNSYREWRRQYPVQIIAGSTVTAGLLGLPCKKSQSNFFMTNFLNQLVNLLLVEMQFYLA